MSFISANAQEKLSASLPEQVTPTAESESISMRIDVLPIPTGITQVSMEKTKLQNQQIMHIRNIGKDLFQANHTLMSVNGSKRLYQTQDLYGKVLAVEDLIPMLTSADLTLRLNALRSGVHSHSTCMELKTGILADTLKKSTDAKGEKVTTVSIESAPDRGRMFVGLKYANGKHYISKVDYEVDSVVDDGFHLK